ncbi:peptidoglycan-binding protein [Geodermatophilus sp. DSM 45219]|uniref:peptidoglycan-binding domain-containing protein n=1 Tax=Geodermatophilus sp. DSM 45219 TaxID=1881103 RepID=UPI000888598F|nr:peptidoglycan-binding protein [Geodermatophilus sp. DSM 45219]SDN95676.1 D-alanyl-D-alanine carboxypeptidase [Geodermatophilus sp. DSM 45219]
MVASQNGYSANDRTIVQSYAIGSSGRTRVTLRKGSTGAMLQHFANWFDAEVQDIDAGRLDDWGYAERNVRDSSDVSNHASGTAVDLNATRWPLGSRASINLSAAQVAAVQTQLQLYEGCIRWGENYSGRTDPMHFEINRDQGTVDRVWAEIAGGTAPAPAPVVTGRPTLRMGSKGEAVELLQRTLNLQHPEYSTLTVDADFGPATDEVVREFQRREDLAVDGVVGSDTWRALGL